MAYCGEASAVKHCDCHKEVVKLVCRAWTCDDCRPTRRKQLMATMINGKPRLFITLTLPAEHATNPEAAVKTLSRAWRLIRKRDARRRNGKLVPFIAVVEKTEAGTPHLHILVRARWMSQEWLSDCMEEIADAPIVWVNRVWDAGRRAGYCAKYSTKATAKIGNAKRYWQSPDYNLSEKPESHGLEAGEFWEVKHSTHVFHVLRNYSETGWTIHVQGPREWIITPPPD